MPTSNDPRVQCAGSSFSLCCAGPGRNGGVFTTPEQRKNPSKYNTYLYKGLPPTPINSPTREELSAAINPAQGSWLYFTLVNLDTGETAFASTATEHQANVKKLQAWCQAHKNRC